MTVTKVICPMCFKKMRFSSWIWENHNGMELVSSAVCNHCGYYKHHHYDGTDTEGILDYAGINPFRKKRNLNAKLKFYHGKDEGDV